MANGQECFQVRPDRQGAHPLAPLAPLRGIIGQPVQNPLIRAPFPQPAHTGRPLRKQRVVKDFCRLLPRFAGDGDEPCQRPGAARRILLHEFGPGEALDNVPAFGVELVAPGDASCGATGLAQPHQAQEHAAHAGLGLAGQLAVEHLLRRLGQRTGHAAAPEVGRQQVLALAARPPGLGQRHLHEREVARAVARIAQHTFRKILGRSLIPALGQLERFENRQAQRVVRHAARDEFGLAVRRLELREELGEFGDEVVVVAPHGQHEAQILASACPQRGHHLDEGAALGIRGLGPELLELVNNQQHELRRGSGIGECVADALRVAAANALAQVVDVGQP